MTFEDELKMNVKSQIQAIDNMECNGPEIFGHYLNDQQRLTIQILKERNFFLNYSETGAGKTKAPISAAYYLGIKHIIIFCPNEVKTTWKRQILEANFIKNHNVVIDGIVQNHKDEFTFEIFNYDKFNTNISAKRRIDNIIKSKKYGMVVFDEVHRLKNKNSQTYQYLSGLVDILRKNNPNVKIFGATATPITTSNTDLQSIYEILSGKCADELTMGNIANKLINANKILETCGFGYFPKSKLNVRYNGIDSEYLFKPKQNGKAIFKTKLANIDGTSIELECIKHKGNISKIEELHLPIKFNAYKHLVKKSTVIYTEYTYGEKILIDLKNLIEKELHLSACIYSGGCKETDDGSHSIEEFVNKHKDVLIATKSMATGVDGLQKRSNRVILHTIPSVWSTFHQLIGRFDRQGSNFVNEGIDVFVPMVVFYLNDGKKTSFDKRRWQMAMRRKIKDDVVKGGHIEEISDIEKDRMISEVIEKLQNKYVLTEIERKSINSNIIDFNNNEIEKKINHLFRISIEKVKQLILPNCMMK